MKSRNPVLGNKAQVLKTIKNTDLGETKCGDITTHTLVAFARELNKSVEPQTCSNYLSHLYLTSLRSLDRRGDTRLSRQEFEVTFDPVMKKFGC